MKTNKAESYLEDMKSSSTDPESFFKNLSSFIITARSVIQYALKEIDDNKNGKKWFDNYVSDKKKIFPYFRDKRDPEIHENPIEHGIVIKMGRTVCITIFIIDPNNPFPDITTVTPCVKSTTLPKKYYFRDNPDMEIIQLSTRYIQEIKDFVTEGMGLGYISG